jgi:hypothetical protein
MILKFAYLAVFLGGLALAVNSMLHGVERWKRRRSARPSAVLNPPTVASLAVAFGASGYLLTTRTPLAWGWVLLLSLVIGVAALTGMIVLMAKWALPNSDALHSDEDDINGQVATVTRTITANEPGEISWYAWEKRHVLPAVAMSETIISEGTEVVIDTVEDGVARVELWSVVESRL